MIQKDPPSWNLGQIEQAYLELRQNPAAAGVANQVDLRFSAAVALQAGESRVRRLLPPGVEHLAARRGVGCGRKLASRRRIRGRPSDRLRRMPWQRPHRATPTSANRHRGRTGCRRSACRVMEISRTPVTVVGGQSAIVTIAISTASIVSVSISTGAVFTAASRAAAISTSSRRTAVAVRVVVSATGRFAVRRPGLVAPVFTTALTAATRTTPWARARRVRYRCRSRTSRRSVPAPIGRSSIRRTPANR